MLSDGLLDEGVRIVVGTAVLVTGSSVVVDVVVVVGVAVEVVDDVVVLVDGLLFSPRIGGGVLTRGFLVVFGLTEKMSPDPSMSSPSSSSLGGVKTLDESSVSSESSLSPEPMRDSAGLDSFFFLGAFLLGTTSRLLTWWVWKRKTNVVRVGLEFRLLFEFAAPNEQDDDFSLERLVGIFSLGRLRCYSSPRTALVPPKFPSSVDRGELGEGPPAATSAALPAPACVRLLVLNPEEREAIISGRCSLAPFAIPSVQSAVS